MPDLIQSLWIGPRLSTMERLCISSFLANGHRFQLYLYENAHGIPPGTEICNAHSILPASRIFKYTGYDTYAGFSNFFRYKLLLEKGGWWVDMDTICLQPLEFSDSFVFSSERSPTADDPRRVQQVNIGVLKAPAGSPFLQEAWKICDNLAPQELAWGQSGPALMARLVKQHSLEQYVQAPEAFCPLDYPEWQDQLSPSANWSFGPRTFAVHLWNELWRRAGCDKDAQWDQGCLYERLKRRYPTKRRSGLVSGSWLRKTIARW